MLGSRGCGKSRVVKALRLGDDLLSHPVSYSSMSSSRYVEVHVEVDVAVDVDTMCCSLVLRFKLKLPFAYTNLEGNIRIIYPFYYGGP